jgi:serine phosphatase RsbU (regulator of sigma subunit)
VEYANEIRRRSPLNLDEPTGVAKVLRTGRSEFYPEISEAMLDAAPEPQREIARTIELSSVMIVPLEVRGTMLGAMTLLYGDSKRHYDELDLRMAESLGRRAAIAIDNASVYRDRDEMARTLQRNLLPPAVPRIPRADVATRYEPFGLHHEAGGDFYDVFPAAEGGWGMLIGDVCGKGAGAAAVMGIARFTLRALALREADPVALFQGLNEALLQQQTDGRFCTATYAWIRPAATGFTAVVSVAGHPPALILRADGEVEEVGPTGALLGIFDDPAIGTTEIQLGPGDALLLYTDGAVGRGSVTGARLAPPREAADDADAIAETFLREAIERGHGELRDDIAVLVFKAA